MEQSLFTAKKYIEYRKKLTQPESYQFPKICVLGFFPALYQHISRNYHVQKVDFINRRHPYFLFSWNNQPVSFISPGIGAPLAGAQLDETIAMGAEKIIFFGSCGVIDPQIGMDSIILLNGAVSDEGTSHHYETSSNRMEPDQTLLKSLRNTFTQNGLSYHIGKSWTTDAMYRETPGEIQKRIGQGCVCVDMESSALYTIAGFYQNKIAGFLIPGDRLTGNSWQPFTPGRQPVCFKPANLLELALDALIKNE